MTSKHHLTQNQELALRRTANSFIGKVLRGDITFKEAMDRLRIDKNRQRDQESEEQPMDAVHQRVIQLGQLFKKSGKCGKVFHPNVTAEDISAGGKRGLGLYFMPASDDISFKDLLRLAGEAEHWTSGSGAPADLPVLEDRKFGYWFWAENTFRSGRKNSTWHDLTGKHDLLSLEEYLVVLACRKHIGSELIDVETSCWLRTMTHSHHPLLVRISREGRLGVNPTHEPNDCVPGAGARVTYPVANAESAEPPASTGDQAIADVFGPESPDLTIGDAAQ